MILGSKEQTPQAAIRQELGEDGYRMYQAVKRTKSMTGVTQARMPFESGDRVKIYHFDFRRKRLVLRLYVTTL